MGINQFSVLDICKRRNVDNKDVFIWCIENLGETMNGTVPVWEGKYSTKEGLSTVFIYDDQKAMMFSLRWL
jgi:hypothetical protein